VKILLIRISSLGDVLHNMPIVQDLLCHFPQAEIDWVVEEAYVELVRLNQGVRKILPVALRRWRKQIFAANTWHEIAQFKKNLQQERYDLVIETQGLFKTGLIMGLAQLAPHGKKVGLANGTEDSGYEAISRLFHDQSVAVERRTHAVLRGRLVTAAAGQFLIDTPANFGLQIPALSNTKPDWLPSYPYAVFFHGSAGQQKKWPQQHWISIAVELKKIGLPILLPWGNAQEKSEAEQMASQMENAQVLPKLQMQEAIILAQQASLVIGVDTGLTHIAAAYCRPTIEIYCASPRWKTEGNWSSQIINLGDDGNPPSVEEVRQALHQLLPNLMAS
jgi:heptosyltransferase-1